MGGSDCHCRTQVSMMLGVATADTDTSEGAGSLSEGAGSHVRVGDMPGACVATSKHSH